MKEVNEGRMEWKRERGTPHMMLLDDIKTNENYQMIKRRALDRESRINGCLEPALKQNTDDVEKNQPW